MPTQQTVAKSPQWKKVTGILRSAYERKRQHLGPQLKEHLHQITSVLASKKGHFHPLTLCFLPLVSPGEWEEEETFEEAEEEKQVSAGFPALSKSPQGRVK
ncbi:hypothetical protein H1C71_010525 [Ictidomys tridecemlineatus]|nr:hypothetical protein H1C71_010525 [Ictidomys tridecemlineatus]